MLKPFIALALVVCALFAPQARALTVHDLMSVANVSEARIRPDGHAVAYVVAALDSGGRAWDADVWIAETRTGETRRLTGGPAWDDAPRWSPDGSGRIAYLSNPGDANQIFLIETEQASSAKPRVVTRAAAGVTQFTWSPDATRIAYLSPGGESEARRARREAGADVRIEDEPAPASRIHILDVATGRDRELPPLDAADITTIEWSPDGTRLAATLQSLPGTIGFFYGSDVYLVDAVTGVATPLVVREGMDFNPRWSPDGRRIAFLSHDGVKDWIGCCYVCVVPADGSEPPLSVSREFDERDYAAEYHWSADAASIYLVAPRGVSRHLYAIDIQSGKSVRAGDDRAVYGGFSFSADGSRVAFLRTTMAEPAEVFVSALEPFVPTPVTRLNAAQAKAATGRDEVVRWKSFDGLEMEGILVRPADSGSREPLPLVTVIHGGPSTPCMAAFSVQAGVPGWPQGEITAHTLAARGYAAFFPNFRGSGGYGRDFLRANVGDWGGGDFKDVMTGIDMLIERGIADPKRLAIAGWSYGGTLAAYAITQTPRFSAAVVGAGVTDHVSQYGTTDIPPMIEAYMGGAPWQVPDTYRRCSSVTHAARVSTPTLLCYGENDARVPPSQGREFYRILKGRNVPAELVIYPRSGHFIFEAPLEADFQGRMLEWLDRWIGGEE